MCFTPSLIITKELAEQIISKFIEAFKTVSKTNKSSIMNVLYLTNKLVKDKKVIPEIIKSYGDNVHYYMVE